MSPKRSNTPSTNASWDAMSRASNATVSTVVAPAPRRLGRGLLERRGVTRREHDRAGASLHQLAHGRLRDVGTAAEHQHRLHRAERILHVTSLSTKVIGVKVGE